MRRLAVCLLVLVTLLLEVSVSVHAAPPGQEPTPPATQAQADAHYALGRDYLEGQLWIDAAQEFETAIELGAPGKCAALGLSLAFYNLGVLEAVDVVLHSANDSSSHGQGGWSCPDLELSMAQIAEEGGDYLSNLPIGEIDWRVASRDAADGQRLDLLWALGRMYLRKAQLEANVGRYFNALRLYQNALSVYERMNAIWEQLVSERGIQVMGGYNVGFFMVIVDSVTEAEILTEISRIYLVIGNRSLSADYAERARTVSNLATEYARMWNEFVAIQVQPTMYYAEGVASLANEDHDAAIQYFDRVLEEESYLGPFQVSVMTLAASAFALPGGEGEWSRVRVFQSIGTAFSAVGEHQTAAQYLGRGLDACEIGLPPILEWYGYSDPASCVAILTELGQVSLALNRLEEATGYFEEAISHARQLGDPTLESSAAFGLGMVEEHQGNAAAALAQYLRAIELREQVASQLPIELLRMQFESGTSELYQRAIPLLWLLQGPEHTFAYVERARARAFLDQLGHWRVDPKGSENRDLIQREAQLQRKLVALERQLQEEWDKPADERSPQAIENLTSTLEAKRQEYKDLLIQLQLTNPEYADLVGVNPLTLQETQALLRDQAPDVTLVEYFVGDEEMAIFVVSPNTFHAEAVPVTWQELRRQAEALLAQMKAKPLLPEAWQEPAQALYSWLIAPVQDYLPPTNAGAPSRLGIIPHDLLHYLPFGLLYDGESHLLDGYTLFYTPSASSLRFIFEKRHPEADTLLAFANPNAPPAPHLRYAVEEVQAVAALYETQPFIGVEATEGRFKSQAGEYGLVHIAAHSDYNPHSPLFSAILLAGDETEDGRLETHEVFDLNLPQTDLVVLSACQTHLGELSTGDELVGLERAFVRAGAPSLLTSLWPVDDAATATLMERFYTHLRAGVSKAEALRLAQLETRAEHPEPYYWAGFVLVGDAGVQGEATLTPQPALAKATPMPQPTPTGGKETGGLCSGVAVLLAVVGVAGWRIQRRKRPQ